MTLSDIVSNTGSAAGTLIETFSKRSRRKPRHSTGLLDSNGVDLRGARISVNLSRKSE
jgi:hypothetical protein